ncbi:Elongator complex protein 4 [Mycotypha africana]|uniref:Elongator complex protein 4 n=1 Tax=Mycotypha africana TaxID=64632 RepID=UPI00230114B0|nr:Elongator complex protein 4 [Mycotypha africana]KAI8967383.1 Elongator complex protein 4 [Mycotypha africana]
MSFKKRNTDQQPKLPSGTRLSAYNGQLLISTGVPSLDDILGGGQPVGTVMLIKEDRATTYAQLLLKYFLAQGISSGHHIAVSSLDEDPEEILKTLMWLSTSGAQEEEEDFFDKQRSHKDSERMKIAWRYSHLKRFETEVRAQPPSPSPVHNSSSNNKKMSSQEDGDKKKAEEQLERPYCSQFDLTKRIPEDVLDEAKPSILRWDDNDNDDDKMDDDYQALIQSIKKVVLEKHFSSAVSVPAGTVRNALRIGIHSLASPCWKSKSPYDLFKFCHALRGLLRFSFGTAMITVPAYLYDEAPNVMKRIEHMVDAVIEIESFAADPVHSDAIYVQNYHGFFHVHKVPVLNSLLPPGTKLSVLSGGGSNDLGFKLRRKRFTIETFHLPPDGGVVTRRTEPPSEAASEGADKASSTNDSDNNIKPSATSSSFKKKNTSDGKKERQDEKKTGSLFALAQGNGPKKINRGAGVGCGSMPGRNDPLDF